MYKKNVLLSTVLSIAMVPGAASMTKAAIVQAIDPLTIYKKIPLA